jgi:hypothetical protein
VKNGSILGPLLAMTWGCAHAASAAPLYVVQHGRIITDQRCEADTPLAWSKVVGITKGAPLLGLTQDGPVEVRAGELSCVIGECGGNYLAIELDGGNERLHAVVRKPDWPELQISKLVIDKLGLDQCDDLLEKIEDPHLPEAPEERSCRSVSLGTGVRILLASKGFRQENGWTVHIAKARVQRSDEHSIVDVDRDTSPFEPILVLTTKSGRPTILWKKESGICCPSEVTVMLTAVDERGSLTFGQPHRAGGQPCD